MRWKKAAATFGALTVLAGGGTFAADRAANPYEDKSTHYELSVVTDIPQGERVEIAKERAAFTLKGWNDEYAITVVPQIPTASFGAAERDFQDTASRPLLSKRMEYKSGDVTAFIEPREASNEFDIDFILDAKPDTNVFTYRIEGAEDFDFFYQPALTEQEIANGDGRPENVIGSYAVYHKEKANHRVGSTNYATGKVMHIYRPKAIDANGNEMWAALSYADGVLSVTVPEKFLDAAVYPVIVDPTFGYTSIGASTSNSSAPVCRSAVTTEDGSITTIHAYRLDSASSFSEMATAVYSDNGGTVSGAVPLDLLATDSGNYTFVGTSADWYTTNLSYSVTNATKYWLCSWMSNTTGNETYYRDTDVSGATIRIGSGTFDTFPDPWAAASQVTFAIKSIYATYTTGGGGAAPSIESDLILFE